MFYWDDEKYEFSFLHPSSILPVLQVNTGYLNFQLLLRTMFQIAGYAPQRLPIQTAQTYLPEDGDSDVYFASSNHGPASDDAGSSILKWNPRA